MYSITNYAQMLADPLRKAALVAAMKELIRPDTVVLDLGAGFGALSLAACKMGAARVYAIEPNVAIRTLETLAQRNGFQDRIRSYCADSRKVELPERVDLIIADLRSYFPLFNGTYNIMEDACKRFLKPGGAVVPFHDAMYVAPVAQKLAQQDIELFWDQHGLDVDLGYVRELAMCTPCRAKLLPEALLSPAQVWGHVNYGEQCELETRAELNFKIERQDVLDGIGFWFDLDFTPGVRLSNAPDQTKLIYGTGFFPLPKPTEVHRGDQLTLKLSVRCLPDREYWSWAGRVSDTTGQERFRFNSSNLPLALMEMDRGGGM